MFVMCNVPGRRTQLDSTVRRRCPPVRQVLRFSVHPTMRTASANVRACNQSPNACPCAAVRSNS